jgi:hypothetical protein
MMDKQEDFSPVEMMMPKGGFREEDILRIHILWVGYAICRVFEHGYSSSNIITLYCAVEALECFLVDKLENPAYAEEKKIIDGLNMKEIFKVVKDTEKDLNKGYETYAKIISKYKTLIKLSKKVHIASPTMDLAFDKGK